MTIYLRLLFCLSFVFCPQIFAWELEKEDEGIRVYTEKREGSEFKAFRADMTLDAGLRQIAAQLMDVESMKDWLHDCSESELISRLDGQEYIVYQKTAAPWPVDDRDYILRSKVSQNPESLVVELNFSALSEVGETNDECVRVTELKGFWRMTPLTVLRTYLEYETHADPGGSLPSWLANSFVVDQPFNTLKNLRQRVQENSTYDAQALSFIQQAIEDPNSEKASP